MHVYIKYDVYIKYIKTTVNLIAQVFFFFFFYTETRFLLEALTIFFFSKRKLENFCF